MRRCKLMIGRITSTAASAVLMMSTQKMYATENCMLRGHFRSEYGITAELSLERMLTNRNVIELYLNKLCY